MTLGSSSRSEVHGQVQGVAQVTVARSNEAEPSAVAAEVVAWVVGQASVIGATGATLMVVDERGDTVAVCGYGSSAHIPGTIGTFSVTRQAPLFRAIDTSEPVWMPSRVAGLLLFPEYVSQLMPGQSLAALPLIAGGRRLGGVILHFADARSFPDLERAYLALLADMAAQTVAAVVWPTPPVAGTDVALLDGMLDPVVVCEPATHGIVYANRAAEALSGRTAEALTAMRMEDLIPTVAGREGPEPHEQGVIPGLLCQADGDLQAVDLHVSAENAAGRRVIVILDTTARTREADERVAAAERMAAAASDKAARQVQDRAMQAVFATSMSLASLAAAVPDELRTRVEGLMEELDDVVAGLREA